ncbi:hypothetical protein HK104_000894 [Borealophlyctis nickersoniae]|nr:hypothetical protein HK104_000894 [Borealophlyctis nickersoniae]
MILPRLRALQYTINKYNEGVRHSTPAFEQYWKPRTLNWLSGVGFQVKDAKENIVIDSLEELVNDVEEVYAAEIGDVKEKIAAGLITFEGLGELYGPDVPIEGRTTLGGTNAVFMVTDAYYEEHRSLVGMEKSFHMTLDFIATVGNHFTVVTFTEVLSGWMGVQARAVGDLTYVPVKSSQMDFLRARGEKYVEYSSGGAQFLAYGSHTFFLHSTSRTGGSSLMGFRQSVLPSGGRVMIDAGRGAELGHYASQGVDEATQAMINRAGQYRRWVNTRVSATSNASSDALPLWSTVPSELRIFTWPALVGFSFSAKAWGHVLVSGLTSIDFQHDAFDRLVLAEDRKQLIRALVRFGSGKLNIEVLTKPSIGPVWLGPTGGCS